MAKRVDPDQLPRTDDMTAHVTERLAEATDRAWLGEVAALEDLLRHRGRDAQVPSRTEYEHVVGAERVIESRAGLVSAPALLANSAEVRMSRSG